MTGSARLALFDLDNTLFDRARAFRSWSEAFVSARQLDRAVVERLIVLDEDGLATRQSVFSALRQECGLRDSVAKLESDYRREYPRYFRADPALVEDLRRLQEDDRWRIGIVTNGPATQIDKIRGLGLDTVVDGWCISDVVGSAKPDREIFEAAAALLGVPLAGYMVGDQTETDVLGGHRVGLRTILVSRGRPVPPHATPPDAITQNVRDAIALIRREGQAGQIARPRPRRPAVGSISAMRAVAIPEFGGPEVLTVADLEVPEPGEGEVRVHVVAATVNPTDLGMRTGNSAAALEAFPKPYVPGMELAGTVDALGPGTTGLAVGDRVLGIAVPGRTGRGAQSEFVVIPAASVTAVPDGTTLEEAATLPMNGLTVRRALDLLDLPAGAWLAVTGAAGAVGGYAVEMGVAAGLRVIAVAGPADEELVKGFGAQQFIPRGDDVASAIRAIVPEGVDAVIDAALVGPPILSAIRDGGKLAVVRGFAGETERDITVAQVRVSDYAENNAALRDLAALVAEGKLTLRVAETFAPEQAAEAHVRLAEGGVRGRLVITF